MSSNFQTEEWQSQMAFLSVVILKGSTVQTAGMGIRPLWNVVTEPCVVGIMEMSGGSALLTGKVERAWVGWRKAGSR